MSVDLSGGITAIATAVLAVFAIVTAIYAIRAFRKQSQEVSAIERQVKDQQELTHQQGKLLEIQSGQLELQSQQLNEQREINALQAEDLRESLKERARQRQVAEREQADKVVFHMSTIPFPAYSEQDVSGFDVAPGDVVHMAVVTNESRRPIRDVACKYGDNIAVVVGRLVDQQPDAPGNPSRLVDWLNRPEAEVIRAGETYGFAFELKSNQVLLIDGRGEGRFTDDVGLHWQLDGDLHLEQLTNRDWSGWLDVQSPGLFPPL